MIKPVNIDFNPSKQLRKIMDERNMRVDSKFVPAVSDYTVPLSNSERIKLHISDHEFNCISEVKTDNKWTPDPSKGVVGAKGSIEFVQNQFMKTLKQIIEMVKK
ncbi:hypothetical protein HDR58_04440 [bacterium]|nr:hypothetical protein [bacterium]